MDSSDELSGLVDGLYRQILRRSELSKPVGAAVIADLAVALTAGGAIRELGDCTDLASTGGPGSISTMLVPLITRASGVLVAKVGVPGRPAGAVDVLANVPGYRWSSTADEFEAAIRCSGFAHTAANETWAPGDAVLFRRRQADGTQGLAPLVVASLLAKKLAAGVRYPGFEVRAAPHGNFGSGRDEVRRNSLLLCEVAACLGMHATVFVTDAEYPHQPCIGRGEALTALLVSCAQYDGMSEDTSSLEGDPAVASWLSDHVRLCERMAAILTKSACQNGTRGAGVDRITCPQESLRSGHYSSSVSTALSEHLLAHGSNWSALSESVGVAVTAPRETFRAEAAGYVRFRMERIRDHLNTANSQVAKSGRCVEATFPDRAGVVLSVPAGARVEPGDSVLSLRWPSELAAPDADDLFEVAGLPPASSSQIGGQLQEIIG